MAYDSPMQYADDTFDMKWRAALEQIYKSDLHGGVEAGNLIDKPSTRELVRRGYVFNEGGPPSSLDRCHITDKGIVKVLDLWIEELEAKNGSRRAG